MNVYVPQCFLHPTRPSAGSSILKKCLYEARRSIYCIASGHSIDISIVGSVEAKTSAPTRLSCGFGYPAHIHVLSVNIGANSLRVGSYKQHLCNNCYSVVTQE